MSYLYQIGCILLSLLLAFILYQKLATVIDDLQYPPPGQLIDIGGYKLHIHTTGQGPIAVVCDAGLSGTSLGWSLVQAQSSSFARVCSYDRAGYAWSDPLPFRKNKPAYGSRAIRLTEKSKYFWTLSSCWTLFWWR